MQLWRRLRHWSVASSITLCCILAQTLIRRCLNRLVDSLLHYTPGFVVNWIEIEAVGRPQTWRDACRSLAIEEVDRLARPVRWGTVLLKDKRVRDLTYGRQQRYCWDSSTSWLMIYRLIGSIDLDSGIDEYQSGIPNNFDTPTDTISDWLSDFLILIFHKVV